MPSPSSGACTGVVTLASSRDYQRKKVAYVVSYAALAHARGAPLWIILPNLFWWLVWFRLQDVFDTQVCEKEIARSLVLEVREVHYKIGNKRFVFQLHSTWPRKPLVKILRSSNIRKLRSNTSIRNTNRILCLSLVPAKDTTSFPKWKCCVSTSDCDLKRVNWRAQTECIPY